MNSLRGLGVGGSEGVGDVEGDNSPEIDRYVVLSTRVLLLRSTERLK